MAKVYFPQYARGRDGVDIAIGDTILAHIRAIGGIEIDSECGGQGVCGAARASSTCSPRCCASGS